MASDLPDAELLNMPTDNLRPGELVRAFQVKADQAAKKLATAQPDEITLMLLAERREETNEAAHEELHRREERLLAELDKREQELLERAERLDTRTIKLDDGRRAYVDGDKYRDAEGRELNDADRAQAEQHHLDQPNAATWQEHEEIERRLRATTQLRENVEALQAKGDAFDTSKALTEYEKAFKAEVAANQKPKQSGADYGSADYMSAYGLSGDFKQAATGASSSPSSLPVPVQPAPQKANAFSL